MYQYELNLLGYTEKWLQSGILSPERLMSDVKEDQSKEEDPYREHYREHYRVATLFDFIDKKDVFTNNEIIDILEIAFDDEDKTMLGATVHKLIKCRNLSDEQFESLQSHPYVQLFDTSRVYTRQKLLRAIDKNGLNTVVLAECLREGDSNVHRRLLEFELDHETLKVLAEDGANKAVRNIANVRLRQRKYRDKTE